MSTTATPIKYNITENDGEVSSITVFIPGSTMPKVATKEHKAFGDIIEAVKDPNTTPEKLQGLFNVGYAVVEKFKRVTERVTVGGGHL